MGQGRAVLPGNPVKDRFNQWMNEEPSVMDSAWEAPLRGLLSVLGANDPTSEITNLMNPTPLISIYKNAAGIPDKALREKGTQQFLESAKWFAPNEDKMPEAKGPLEKAAGWFAERYPRVAAHMRIQSDPVKMPFGAAVETPRGKVTEPIPMMVSRLGMASMIDDIPNAFNMMAHEGTHVAQALGNKNMDELYDLASNLVGYNNNPFERTAVARGTAAELRGKPQWRGAPLNDGGNYTALRGLNELTQLDPHDALIRPTLKPTTTRDLQTYMDEILRNRANSGWKPSPPPSNYTGKLSDKSIGLKK